MTTPIMPVRRLHPDALLPHQANPGDAGWDLHSAESGTVHPHDRMTFGTGIAVAIPTGHVGYIKPRSGLAASHGINVLGGVIDAGYRGELRVILHNTGNRPVTLNRHDRIAQLVVQPIHAVNLSVVDSFDDATARGEGGFGSTGTGAAQ